MESQLAPWSRGFWANLEEAFLAVLGFPKRKCSGNGWEEISQLSLLVTGLCLSLAWSLLLRDPCRWEG